MLGTTTPADVGWYLTHHLRTRAIERGISENEILDVLDEPEVTYSQSAYGLERQVHQRGRLSVVVDARTRAAITVMFRSHETWLGHLEPSRAAA
jgi:hypothetical protein